MFDPTQPIYQRPDNSNSPGGLIVTYNNERILLINEGSPWFDPSKEPEGLREEVFEFIRLNPSVVQPEPPEPPELPEPPRPAEQRKIAYQSMFIIEWFEGEMLTVDRAVLLHSSYYAEWLAEHETTDLIPDDHIIHIISVKIKVAKDEIRQMFPD